MGMTTNASVDVYNFEIGAWPLLYTQVLALGARSFGGRSLKQLNGSPGRVSERTHWTNEWNERNEVTLLGSYGRLMVRLRTPFPGSLASRFVKIGNHQWKLSGMVNRRKKRHKTDIWMESEKIMLQALLRAVNGLYSEFNKFMYRFTFKCSCHNNW